MDRQLSSILFQTSDAPTTSCPICTLDLDAHRDGIVILGVDAATGAIHLRICEPPEQWAPRVSKSCAWAPSVEADA